MNIDGDPLITEVISFIVSTLPSVFCINFSSQVVGFENEYKMSVRDVIGSNIFKKINNKLFFENKDKVVY